MVTVPEGMETMSSAMAETVNYHRWIHDLLRPWVCGKKVLEIGAGLGQYAEGLNGTVREHMDADVDLDCLQSFKL
jgi:hypothetical protein